MAPSLIDMLNNREPLRTVPRSRKIGDAAYTELLKDLQSNILTPHGLDRAKYWLIKFDRNEIVSTKYLIGMLARNAFERVMIRQALDSADAADVMGDELKTVAGRWKKGAPAKVSAREHYLVKDLRIASEYEAYWRNRAEQRRSGHDSRKAVAEGEKPVRFAINVLLTRHGYEKLEIEAPPDKAFNDGMSARRDLLRDSRPATWDDHYHAGDDAAEIDAMLIIAHDPASDEQLAPVEALREIVQAHATILHEEEGRVLRASVEGKEAYAIEPFGFCDSASQLAFYEAQKQDRRGNAITTAKWDPFAPLNTVLAPDPHGKGVYACGTYFVFRKLEQNITRFYEQSEKLAKETGLKAAELRDQFIGRRPDGEPLVPVAAGADRNDFDFVDDQEGLKCPFHAHVRKSNPRSDVRESYAPRSHRIVRRGMSYGRLIDREDSGLPTAAGVKEAENEKIGLLFLCAQSNIETHFEHLQSSWMNEPKHPRGRPSGVDALSGQVDEETFRLPLENRKPEVGNPARIYVDYQQVVTLKGGEYFFAPSISFLRSLLGDLLKM